MWITIREIFVINCQQEEVELWLKLSSYIFQVTNTLIVLDDCAPSKDVKGRTGQLVSLGCSARHAGISVRVLTQQITNISNHSMKTWLPSFCFTLRRAKPGKSSLTTMPESFPPEEYKELMAELKTENFPIWFFAPRHPFGIEILF